MPINTMLIKKSVFHTIHFAMFTVYRKHTESWIGLNSKLYYNYASIMKYVYHEICLKSIAIIDKMPYPWTCVPVDSMKKELRTGICQRVTYFNNFTMT